ncbi:unnamed protein product (macronuclear) [Paramecium tetraurelia]|uniref:Transmembrane protein n=1 Tax=Paramecium tetraurelia TaxID=5888 RepID=A0CEQ6_PARTE|nr:uncharacterized protein GSPATT00037712001 [Paramecium tetraurelia]CAK69273.1 unnamed protein product [Paramecium tetraurelia]|eukprot:XP_001436670.1 hypothetical protein (macronuclear) [Paramecium tetraurelia strain d4-2]
MNSLFLYFKDPRVEQSYQISNQHSKRLSTFISLSFGFIIAFVVKVIQSSHEKNNYGFILNLSMLIYLIVQLIFVWKNNQYLRLGIILLNHSVTIFFIAFEDRSGVDNQMAMLQGVNQMAATYLLVLNGEYVDGMITIITLQIFRLLWGVFKSDGMQYSALVTSTLLILYINYFNYQYNKAKRSQYLLTLADTRWEDILQKLLLQQSYLILQFSEENLHFSVKQLRNCEKLFKTEPEAYQFLKQATHQNKIMQNVIYGFIRQFQENNQQTFNNTFLINFLKRTIRAEISIYQGDKPTILLLFKEFFYERRINTKMIQVQYESTIKLMVKILNRINQYQFCKNKYLSIQRKLIFVHLIQNINKDIKLKKIQLNNFLNNAIKLHNNVKVSVQYQGNPSVETCVNILQIIILQIFQNILSQNLIIRTSQTKNQKIRCQFLGYFNIQKILRFKDQLETPFQLLFESYDLNQETLQFIFPHSIDIPFNHC